MVWNIIGAFGAIASFIGVLIAISQVKKSIKAAESARDAAKVAIQCAN